MFQKIKLENGLRVITVPVKGVTTVTILVMVDTGSNNESKDLNGISHFLEHMFFKGTKNRPTTQAIASEIDGMGGYSNAYTSRENTGYYLKVPAQKFDQALDLISDIFFNSILDQQEVDKERGVILQELRMIHDDPQRYVGEVFEDLLYGDQPAGWDIIGTPETLQRIQSEKLRDYFSSQYTVENTFVVVAGNVDEKEAVEKVKAAFNGIRKGETRKRPLVREEQTKAEVSIFFKKTDQTHFILGNRAFGVNDPRRFPASVLAHILGGSMASRIFEEVREKRGLAYAINTFFDDYTTYGAMATYAGVEHENTEKTIPVILDEYKKIKEKPVSAEELLRTKESMKGHLALSLESSNALAFYVGGEEVSTGKPLTVEEVFSKIDAVTAGEVQKTAQEIFKKESLNLAIIGPFKAKERFEELLEDF